jgi:hypothetical protein
MIKSKSIVGLFLPISPIGDYADAGGTFIHGLAGNPKPTFQSLISG